MSPQIDVGKLVGAASAPVGFIIATSIFLGNVGGKYAMLTSLFRESAREYRETEDRDCLRSRSLARAIALYSGQLRLLIQATLWLTISLQCFILTVTFTSVGVIFPQKPVWTWLTVFFSFAGLFLLAAAIVIEIVENHRAKLSLALETAEFTDALPGDENQSNQKANKDAAEQGR